nr:aminodeoxychorismate lyase [Thiomicrorhabdus cannonii]
MLGIWVDGVKQTQLAVQDRAVQYGDGFFTTILLMQGKVFNWPAHWRRVQTSAERLGFPAFNEEQLLMSLRQALTELPVELQLAPLMAKLIVTRGIGGAGYAPLSEPTPAVIWQLAEHPLYRQVEDFRQAPQALTLGICQTQAAIQPQLAGLKHLNRLDNVLARAELAEQNLPEGIMLNAFGEVVSATQANLFMLKDGCWLTPVLQYSGVAGTTRAQLLQLVPQWGFEVVEQRLTLADIEQADELFVTNALRGIMPVKVLAERTFGMVQGMDLRQRWCDWQWAQAQELLE